MKSQRTMILLTAFALSLAAAVPGRAQAADVDAEIKEILKRIKDRTPQLLEYKNAGTIGETAQARVEKVKSASGEDITKLLAAENKDRARLIQLLSQKHQTDADEARKNFALFRFKQARGEHYFKGLNGRWLTKQQWIEQDKNGGVDPFDE